MKACAIIVSFNHWLGASQDDAPFAREFVHALKDRNPNLHILLIDNASATPYPKDIGGNVRVLRLEERIGYGPALNKGLLLAGPGCYDWFVCFNNDCWIDPNPNAPVNHGRIEAVIDTLDPHTVYGSGWNVDKRNERNLQWSAWMCISLEALQAVGYFDEELAAAFEDFDYERRALAAGFQLDTAPFQIVHLDEHTRLEDPEYKWRWERARMHYEAKHGAVTEPWLIVKGSK